MELVNLRLRSRSPESEILKKKGKIVTPEDYNLLLTGPTRVYTMDNRLLCVYMPGALADIAARHYEALSPIRDPTSNRTTAAAVVRFVAGNQRMGNTVLSTVLGALEPNTGGSANTNPTNLRCRLTEMTGRHMERYKSLRPVFTRVAGLFKEQVPDRYAIQKRYADETHPDWVVKGTPFSTFTVNNTFPTGVHKDAGDLEKGFSAIAVWRRGAYTGGHLVFPSWRVAVDLHEGDLILMDAHEWHGNTALRKLSADAERISVVFYYRTNLINCPE